MTKDKQIKKATTRIVKLVAENSTIMPFRWSTKNYFTCYFCGSSFESIAILKQHTDTVHETDKTLTHKCYYRRIKLDVSDISCKRCPKKFENLEELLNHMSYAHDLKFNKDMADNLVCFRLTDGDLSCLHCGEKFASFGTLLMHDNRYHNNSKTFACNTCGEAFISKYILASHIYYKHDEKRCKICNEVFKTAFALTSHKQKVHEVDKLKCPECSEILGSKYLQKQHLRLVHGVGNKPLICDICSRTFVTRKTLRDHKARVHMKEKSIACEICGFKVFSRGVLTLHMVKHSDARPFVCEVCQKTFRRKKTLETHMKLHKNYKPYECSDCDKAFVQNGNLKKHIRVCHSEPESSVRACGSQPKNSNKADLLQILTVITENSTIMPFRWYANKFMCFYCCCPFEDCFTLKQHTISEHAKANLKNVLSLVRSTKIKLDVTDVTCKRCTKTLHNLEEFLAHASSIHDLNFNKNISKDFFSYKLSEKDNSCLECGQSFDFFGTLLKHVHKHHNKSNEFLCNFCGQGFIAKANVTSHIRNVHGQTECEKCQEVFPTQNALKVHFEKAHKVEKLKCPQCPEILGSRYLKQRHLVLVHDVKSDQHKCDVCSKIFPWRNQMLKHKAQVHLKKKSLTCEICGLKVFNVQMLKSHMVCHDDSRPFQCEVCNKGFQRKKTLDLHSRIHTDDKRYACKECGKTFVQWTSWKNHQVKAHNSK